MLHLFCSLVGPTKDSDGLNHWQLLIQKYFEFLSGLVPWVGDVWIF